MNKSYRLIYNDITQTWVAASEITKGRGKRASGAVLLAGAGLLSMAALAPVYAAPPNATTPPAATQLPTGGQVVAGQASINQSAATLNVNQTSNRAALDWQTFNVGKSATVNFNQPSSNSVALNRVADANPSQIFGRINANGQVFLSNPNGVYFAPGASVDVGGLVATTHTIGLSDFMAGNAKFERAGSTAGVLNEGELKAALGGYIALLAPEVRNQGIVIAQTGTVALAAGEAISLHIEGGNTLAGISVSPSLIAALVENKTLVLAPGGLIILSAQAANKLQGGVIKNSGTLDASSLVSRGGHILLDASERIEHTGVITAAGSATQAGGRVEITAPQVSLAGSVDVSGGTGGSVLVNAAVSLVASGDILARGLTTGGGAVQLTSAQTLALQATAQVDVSGAGKGGTVALTAGSSLQLAGSLKATGDAGGAVSLSGGGPVTLTDAGVDASGDTQGGTITVRADKTLRPASQATSGLLDPANPLNDPTAPPEDRPLVALTGNTTLRSNGRSGKGGAIELTGDGLAIATGTTLDASGATAGGTVRVAGDFVALGGNIGADGASGGQITVVSQGTLSLAEEVHAKGLAGDGGSISYSAGGRIIENDGSHTDASGTQNGGAITVEGGRIFSSGRYASTGATGQGGRIDMTAVQDINLLSGHLDASGQTQGGLIRIGGAFQGGKTIDAGGAAQGTPEHDRFVNRWGTLPSLLNAQKTLLNDSSTLNVSASKGEGGSAIVWSDAQTTMVGAITATGSTRGGAVEISSANELRRTDLMNVNIGSGGQLLLDPKNITIGNVTTSTAWSYAAIMGLGYNPVSKLEASDFFGSAVSLNAAGDRLAVGAYGDDGLTNAAGNSGAVYLFSFTDTGFGGGKLQATLGKGYSGGKNINVAALEVNDSFGYAVSLNAAGDRLAVGAYRDGGSANSTTGSGAAYLFSFSDTSFTGGALQATLGKGYTGSKDVNVTALALDDNFGSAVSLNAAGDKLAVGAHNDDGSTNAVSNSGAVYLFSFSDTNFTGGTLQATLGKDYSTGKNVNVTALAASDEFGYAVSLNAAGDRLAVGAFNDNGSANNTIGAGAVYLYSFSDTSFTGGTLQATLGKGYTTGKNVDVTPLEAYDRFGTAVSLNATGDRLAVGAVGDGGSNNASIRGAVYLYSFSDTSFTGGTLQATLGAGYTGGKNVDLSQLVFADDFFANSVSLNAAGDRLVVGAYSDAGWNNIASDSGAVYLFSFTDTSFSGGALQATLGRGYSGIKDINVTALEASDQLGSAVSLNAAGNRLAVGAPGDDGSGNAVSNSGAVSLFSFTDTSFSGGTLQATLGKGYTGGKNVDVAALEASDAFGTSVSLNATGDRLAVGAAGDAGSGNSVANSGAAYLFSFTDTSFSGGTLQATLGNGYSGAKDVNMTALEASDGFGASVSLNAAGDRLAVGSPGDDGSSNGVSNSGAVSLFSFADTNFSGGTLQATLGNGYTAGAKDVNLTALEASDAFGTAVSLNATGNRLAVGAWGDSGPSNATSQSGAAYLLSFTDTSFSGGTLQATLGKGYTGGKNVDVTALEATDRFGTSLSLNAAGDRLAVGAPKEDGSGNFYADAGAVYLFSFSDTNFTTGTLQGTMGANYSGGKNVSTFQLGNGDNFGSAVSLNAAGDRLAVGAALDNGSTNKLSARGAVHLFSFSDTSFTSGTLLGSMGKYPNGYEPLGNEVNLNVLAAQDAFGTSVALNAAGDRLAVGADQDDASDNATSNSGAVYLFSFTDTNYAGGALQATLGKGYTGGKNVNVTALEAGDRFGYSVSLNGAGDRLAVGAFQDGGSGNSAAGSGAAYLFSFSDTSFSGGTQEARLGKGYTGTKDINVPL
ncbi:MAG: filamentous hemagglutinin N-terminal domain-containing protein, partial [Rhodoferax sp.]|nr:filamentous hemagglutinin N-terminal domain-containing protein [Rhodoferax sp.]